jgi:hypothetical protein
MHAAAAAAAFCFKMDDGDTDLKCGQFSSSKKTDSLLLLCSVLLLATTRANYTPLRFSR